MTISSTVRIAGPFIGTGTATYFPFTFKVFNASDLQVVRVDTTTGVETTLLITTNYVVNLNADQDSNPGGSIVLVSGALAIGFNLIITSDIANLQPTDLTNQGGFYPEVITDALDRATIQIQQMSDELTRSIKIPVTDGLSLDMELPSAAARANSFLAFDATGEPTMVTAGSPGAPTSITRQQFSGTGSQVAYTLASDPGALGNSCEVFVGGIYQQRDTYTIAGTTLTFTAAPVAGTDNIEVVNFLTTAIGTTDSSLVTYVPAGTSATQRTVQAKLRDVVSVKDFGNDLAAAITAIGATLVELVIDTPVIVSVNATIPTTMSVRVVRGGGITINNTITLTVNGLFAAPTTTVFTLVGTGSVVFGTSTIKAAYPQWWGASGDGTTNCTTSIQAAMDAYKVVQLIPGTYLITSALQFKSDGIQILGSGMSGATTINRTGSGIAFENDQKATITRLFCVISNLKIVASAAGANAVVDWRSMQFGRLTNLWIVGQSTANCSCIRMDVATFGVTEATYNIVSGCYMGICAVGINIGDGANSNLFIGNRIQTSFSGGYGILLSGTTAGAVSNNSIMSNGFEFPGTINTGILVFQNTDQTLISGNRFESLANGVSVGATSNKNVNAAFASNYFSSCINNINLTSSPTGSGNAYAIRASASISGTGGLGPLVFNDVQFNMGGSKSATGTYAITFTDGNLPSTGYVINATSDQPNIVVTAKSTSGLTIETRNSLYVLTDATRLDVVISHNR